MRVLLDTHALLWMALADVKLSTSARAIMADVANTCFVSPASYWEIAIKVRLGKYALYRPFDDFVRDAIACNRFEILPIQVAHAMILTQLPLHHRDPFDRMLIAQAIAEDIPIISSDAAFDAYPLKRIW